MTRPKWLQRGTTVAVGVPVTLLVLTNEWSTAAIVHALHYLALLEFSDGVRRTLQDNFPHHNHWPLNVAPTKPTLFLGLSMIVGAAAHWGPSAVGLAFPIAVASIALEHLLRVPAATISRNGLVTSNDVPISDDANKTSSVKATATSTSAALAADLLGLGWIALGFAHLLLLRFSGPNGSGHCLFLLLVVWQTDNGALFAGSAARALSGVKTSETDKSRASSDNSSSSSSSSSSSRSRSSNRSSTSKDNSSSGSGSSSSSSSGSSNDSSISSSSQRRTKFTASSIQTSDPVAAWCGTAGRQLAAALQALSPAKTVSGLAGGLILGTATAAALGVWPLQVAPPTVEAAAHATTATSYDTYTGAAPSDENNLGGPYDCEGYGLNSNLGSTSSSNSSNSGECTCQRWLLTSSMPCWPAAWWCALGISIACLAVIGDLIESAFKRTAGIKDSGALFPGHGGCLDRMDSLLLAAPAYFYAIKIVDGVAKGGAY